MKSFFSLIRFLLLPVTTSVMGWDDLLMGLAMYAGKAAISKEMEGDTSMPGKPGQLQQMDLNSLIAQAQQEQAKQKADTTGNTTSSLHFNKY